MQSIYAKKGARLPRLQHVSLPVPAGAQAEVRAFYADVIGLEEKPVPHTLAHLGLVWFAVGDGEMELHLAPDSTHPAHLGEEVRHICLEVDDLTTYRSKIQAAGYAIFDAEPIPHRPRFFCHDPFGNRLEFTTILAYYSDAE